MKTPAELTAKSDILWEAIRQLSESARKIESWQGQSETEILFSHVGRLRSTVENKYATETSAQVKDALGHLQSLHDSYAEFVAKHQPKPEDLF